MIEFVGFVGLLVLLLSSFRGWFFECLVPAYPGYTMAQETQKTG